MQLELFQRNGVKKLENKIHTSKRGGHIEETVGSKGNCIVKKTIKVVIKDEGK